MAEEHLITEKVDVQSELDQIKALGKAIGAILIDGAQIDSEDVGELGYLVFHLAEQVEKKLDGRAEIIEPMAASLPEECCASAQDAAGIALEGKETKSAEIIRMAGNFLQIGSIHAFVLYQVVETMRILHQDEIREMSKAIASFERMGRERRFRQVINEEVSGSMWRADFHKIEKEEAEAEVRKACEAGPSCE